MTNTTRIAPWQQVERMTSLIGVPSDLVLGEHDPSRKETLCGFGDAASDPSNGDRAKDGLRGIGTLREESNISDKIGNLLHLAHQAGYDPIELVRAGIRDFLLEACDRKPETEEVICKSGLRGWQARLREQYDDFEEFEVHRCHYGIHTRLGYKTPKGAWKANPLVQGSVEPSDFRKVPSKKK